MAFPDPGALKHIPLTDEQEAQLTSYLSVELQQAEADREGLIDRLIEEIRRYEARPEKARKDHPWDNASNLVIPIIGSMVDTIFPRIYSTLFGVEPTFTVEEKRAEVAKMAKAYQNYLEVVQREEMRVKDVAVHWFLEGIIHGMSVTKLVWEKIVTSAEFYDDDGSIQKVDEFVEREGPILYNVPWEDFFYPMYARSIKEAPWCSHRIRTYWGAIQKMESSGIYKDIEKIQFQYESTSNDYEREREGIEDTTPSFQEEYELHEVWMDYDYNNDGVDERLVCTYHLPSSQLIRVQFNPYWHRRKPFREFVYWPRHHRLGGQGIATMVTPLQDEVSTLHNQGIDNRSAGNNKVWEVVSGSTADRNFTGVTPGMKIKVDKLGEEIQPVEFATKLDGFSDAEEIALRYAQQRTGVSDFLSGTDFGAAGRETATTTMVRMQEARTRFNWTMDSARGALSDIAVMTTSLLQQFGGDRDIEAAVGEEEAALVREFLESPEDEVRERANIFVTASSASLNKEAEKQNLIALVQLHQNHTLTYEMPLVQIVLNPQAPQELKDYALGKLQGMRVLFDRILQTFDSRNTEEILGSLQAIEAALGGQPAAVPQPFQGGGEAGLGGLGALSTLFQPQVNIGAGEV